MNKAKAWQTNDQLTSFMCGSNLLLNIPPSFLHTCHLTQILIQLYLANNNAPERSYGKLQMVAANQWNPFEQIYLETLYFLTVLNKGLHPRKPTEYVE